MMWRVKRYTRFVGNNNREYRVEFLIDSATAITPEECTPGVPPLVLSMPEVSRTDVVVGTGITINLISSSDRQLIDMYTSAMQSIKVRVYRSDNAPGTASQSYTKIFDGWLDSELYTEPYNVDGNYQVSLTANDGKNILSRLSFVDTDGSHYSDIKSHWEILGIIVERMGVDLGYIYLQTDTIFTGSTIDSDFLCPTYAARSTSDQTLSGLRTLSWTYSGSTRTRALQDGDAVLLTGQTNAAQNGLWIAHSGAWARHTSADTWDELKGLYVLYAEDKTTDGWFCSSYGQGTINTTVVNFSQASISNGVTTLHETFQKCSNFYDEDGEPMSMLFVLESIMRSNRCRFVISDNNIFLTNTHVLSSYEAVEFLKFSASDFAYTGYIGKETLYNRFDLQFLRRAASSCELSVAGGFNKQQIRYSRYMEDVPESDDSNINLITPRNHTFEAVSFPPFYRNVETLTHEQWGSTFIGSGASFNATKQEMDDEPDYHISFVPESDPYAPTAYDAAWTYQGQMPYVTGKTGKALCIDIESFTQTKTNPYVQSEEYDPPYYVYSTTLYIQVKIGEYTAKIDLTAPYIASNITNAWEDAPEKYGLLLMGGDMSINPKQNRWVGPSHGPLIVPLLTGLSGELSISVLRRAQWGPSIEKAPATVQNIWLRGLKVSAVDVVVADPTAVFTPSGVSYIHLTNNSIKNITTDDIIRIGKINNEFKDDGPGISLSGGCSDTLGSPLDRAGLMFLRSIGALQYITQWSSAGYNGTIEEHLLRTIMSNYSTQSLSLNGMCIKVPPSRGISRNVSLVVDSNASLSGLDISGTTYDDGTVVLLTANTSASENGPWIIHSGSWARPQGYSWNNVVEEQIVCGGVTYVSSAQFGGTLDATAQYWIPESFGIHSTFTDVAFLSGHVFLPTSVEIDYRDASMRMSLSEIFPDTANIILE